MDVWIDLIQGLAILAALGLSIYALYRSRRLEKPNLFIVPQNITLSRCPHGFLLLIRIIITNRSRAGDSILTASLELTEQEHGSFRVNPIRPEDGPAIPLHVQPYWTDPLPLPHFLPPGASVSGYLKFWCPVGTNSDWDDFKPFTIVIQNSTRRSFTAKL